VERAGDRRWLALKTYRVAHGPLGHPNNLNRRLQSGINQTRSHTMSTLPRGIIAFGALVIIAVALQGKGNSDDAAAPTPAPEPELNIEAAADVGDTVKIKYPASTIICSDPEHASKVYIAGELALRQTYRVENSIWSAVKAEHAAHEAAIRNYFSCYWASREARYTVEQKEIIGDDTALFHAVKYRIKPAGKTDDWWLAGRYGSTSPFDHVEHPSKAAIKQTESPIQ
jgi:hypothetical protein